METFKMIKNVSRHISHNYQNFKVFSFKTVLRGRKIERSLDF